MLEVSERYKVRGSFKNFAEFSRRVLRMRRVSQSIGMIFTFWGFCELIWPRREGCSARGAGVGELELRAFWRAPSTSWPQWIFMGGRAPRSPVRSWAERFLASSLVLPLRSSVAMEATAIAVWQPKAWNEARSMTRLPSFSVNLSHMRIMSPQSGEPTVPTESASAISPWFLGDASAFWIFVSKSLMVVGEFGRDFAGSEGKVGGVFFWMV